MKVILLRPIERLGKPFDSVEVSDGYARNYLFPRNFAIPATEANAKGLEKSRQRFSKQLGKKMTMNLGLVEQLNNLTVKTTIKVGLDGKSFGSITTSDLADLLKAEGVAVDKKHIILEEPIKHPGVYDIKVHLGEKVNGVFKLVLIEEGA